MCEYDNTSRRRGVGGASHVHTHYSGSIKSAVVDRTLRIMRAPCARTASAHHRAPAPSPSALRRGPMAPTRACPPRACAGLAGRVRRDRPPPPPCEHPLRRRLALPAGEAAGEAAGAATATAAASPSAVLYHSQPFRIGLAGELKPGNPRATRRPSHVSHRSSPSAIGPRPVVLFAPKSGRARPASGSR